MALITGASSTGLTVTTKLVLAEYWPSPTVTVIVLLPL